MAAAPSTLPLYIKLLNGQQGSSQAAELQFGTDHNTGYGSYPAVQPNRFPPNPISSQGHSSQGQQALGLPQATPASPALASSAVGLGYAAPVDVVAQEPSLPSPSVTQPVLGESSPVLSNPPLSVAPETTTILAPLAGVPAAPSVSEGSQDANVVAETSAGPPVVAQSLKQTVAATANNLNFYEDEVLSGTLSPGLFRHLPVMYQLPSFGARQGEGQYIIIMPEHRTKFITAGDSNGKVRDVKVYLATGVRLLRPHQHNELGNNLSTDARKKPQ